MRFINDVRSKGATPILITPAMRRSFDSTGKFVDSHGDYPAVVKEVGTQMNAPVIDLHKSSEALILKEGFENSKRFFLHIPPYHFRDAKAKKTTHTSVNMAQRQWRH